MTYFTQDQIAKYKKDGFITLPQLLSPDETTQLADEILRIQEAGDTGRGYFTIKATLKTQNKNG